MCTFLGQFSATCHPKSTLRGILRLRTGGQLLVLQVPLVMGIRGGSHVHYEGSYILKQTWCLSVCSSQTPTHWTCWRPAATARWFVAPDGCVRGESAQRLGFGREAKKTAQYLAHTHARAVSSSNALSSHPPTNPREREDFWPRSGFGNFDLLLLVAAGCCADSWRDFSVTKFYRKKWDYGSFQK